MTRRLALGLVLVAALLVAGTAAAYTYFFSGLRTSPQPLALASPSASASATPVAGVTPVGRWSAGQGSEAGYRVKELFVGETSQHEAVARTSDVGGGFTMAPAAGGFSATSLRFSVQLTNLHSVDQVAGYNVTNRDFFVQRSLDVQSYPSAVFEADSVAVSAQLADSVRNGSTVSLTVPGRFTIHGVTKPKTVTARIRLAGDKLEVVAKTGFKMTDFDVSPPQVAFTSVRDDVTVEVLLMLSKSA